MLDSTLLAAKKAEQFLSPMKVLDITNHKQCKQVETISTKLRKRRLE